MASVSKLHVTTSALLQLQVAKDIIAKDGAGGLYKGLSAGLLRQATYTTARLGIFQIFSDLLKQQNQGKVKPIRSCRLQSPAMAVLCLAHLCPVIDRQCRRPHRHARLFS